jgi:hypothetical protein
MKEEEKEITIGEAENKIKYELRKKDKTNKSITEGRKTRREQKQKA